MPTTREASIVCDTAIHAAIRASGILAYRIKSFDNSHSAKTQSKLRDWLRARDYMLESVFDANTTRGRRYMAFIYKDQAGRLACFNYLTGRGQ